MDTFYVVIALLTAGGSLVTCFISLAAAAQKGGEKQDLFLGIMSLCLFVFLIFPPIGFAITDKAPFSGELIFKRFFITAYYILFPWFLELYTGFKKRIAPILANGFMVISYTLMAFTSSNSPKSLWMVFAMATFTVNVCYGFYLVRKQIKAGGNSNANWLLAALVTYAVLLLAEMTNQFGNNFLGRMLGSELFFPFHFHSLAFIVIMSIRLRAQVFEKYKLEKSLHLTDTYWNSLLQKASREIQQLKNELEKENLKLKAEPLADGIHPEIIGESNAIKHAIQRARQAAPTSASILLEGETGVGKELFADFIYRFSQQNNKPFIKVNCGALPAELIESELFGYEKGAFTGATQFKKGRFELADGGIIFLDEIGELPLVLQPKLLRVLQKGEFQRLGGQDTIKVNVRIISATHRNLEKEVQQGKFREDLFYRLNVFPITIPALRNRKDDIPLLIKSHIKKINLQYGKEIEEISKADITRLCEYPWPGNVRELENVIERSVISSTGKILKLDWSGDGTYLHLLTHTALEQIEREHIQRVLLDCGGKINGENGAAEKLAMNPNTLRSRMKKLRIERP